MWALIPRQKHKDWYSLNHKWLFSLEFILFLHTKVASLAVVLREETNGEEKKTRNVVSVCGNGKTSPDPALYPSLQSWKHLAIYSNGCVGRKQGLRNRRENILPLLACVLCFKGWITRATTTKKWLRRKGVLFFNALWSNFVSTSIFSLSFYSCPQQSQKEGSNGEVEETG